MSNRSSESESGAPVFLDPHLLETVVLGTVESPAGGHDLLQLFQGPWNCLVASSTANTYANEGVACHFRFDGEQAETPAALVAGANTPGIVVVVGDTKRAVITFSKVWNGPLSLAITDVGASPEEVLFLTYGMQETSQTQAQPIPGIGINRAGG